MRRALALILVSVVAAACGSSGDAASQTTEGKKYVDALMKSYNASQAKKSITATEARCISEASIDELGVSTLKKAKTAPSDLDHGSGFATLAKNLSKSDVARASAAIVDANCLNPGEVLMRTGVAKAKAFAKIPEAKVRCIFVKLGTSSAARKAFADSLLGLAQGETEFSEAFRNKPKFLSAGADCGVAKKLLE
ncbi:MAG: hypothetical protein ABJC79_07755 [Acidimicrobiia bacterium]